MVTTLLYFHTLYVNTMNTVTVFPVLRVLGDWATTHLRSALQPSLLLQVAGCHSTRTIQPQAGFLAQFISNYLDVQWWYYIIEIIWFQNFPLCFIVKEDRVQAQFQCLLLLTTNYTRLNIMWICHYFLNPSCFRTNSN